MRKNSGYREVACLNSFIVHMSRICIDNVGVDPARHTAVHQTNIVSRSQMFRCCLSRDCNSISYQPLLRLHDEVDDEVDGEVRE